ncbi:protein ST7 homolog [Bombyx mandarina]|uniref:Protein ST7 homolog n=1 Tax=Bombyx mandarina TaxID=7092 RepID=A0A6J2JFM2_BOMMA|nr:protein ST7 homolog [Bombyx mandarina]
MWDTNAYLSALTPKFYVALTGTSSLISGLILIFEWWYFRKYGTSFIEQVSLSHLGPWLGGGNETDNSNTNTNNTASNECKVWRNPMALLRGAEYGRLWSAARRAPLTYYDMNLSAQDHQAWFSCGGDQSPVEEAMNRAWREREPTARVAAARTALARDPDCAAALLLLAEEDSPTVQEAERVLKRAWRAAEASWRAHAAAGSAYASAARRDAAVLAHVKRRVAMCARRLGKLRDAARMFRELTRDAPPALHAMSLHENLIEVLLEQRLYADAAAVVARFEDAGAPPSAALLYTAALLRARAAVGVGARPGAEVIALEAIRRAIEFNPHVPEYLLELRALTLPPEHVLRRGDSEAVAYAFFHLRHWRNAEGALRLVAAAWAGAERAGAGAGAGCAACADRELLAPHHAMSAFPRRRAALLPLAAALCAGCAVLALAAHRWPAHAHALLDPRRLHSLLAAV